MMASELDLAVKSIMGSKADEEDEYLYGTSPSAFPYYEPALPPPNSSPETPATPPSPTPSTPGPAPNSPSPGSGGCDEAVDSLINVLINETIHGVVLEMHRAAKLGYVFLDEPEPEDMLEYAMVENPLADVFGQSLYGSSTSKQIAEILCPCPVCERSLCAARFAPHLEKCMGMGRTSSRLASRRIAATHAASVRLAEEEPDDPADDEDWLQSSSSSRRATSRRQKAVSSGTGNGRAGGPRSVRKTTPNQNNSTAASRLTPTQLKIKLPAATPPPPPQSKVSLDDVMMSKWSELKDATVDSRLVFDPAGSVDLPPPPPPAMAPSKTGKRRLVDMEPPPGPQDPVGVAVPQFFTDSDLYTFDE